jgi:pyruvate/2-oxoglutarate dehydrogenase complex dihydrolipoamide acyltransferase (E2) component
MKKPSRFPAVAGTLAGLLTAAFGAWLLYPQHIGPGATLSRPAAAAVAPSPATPPSRAAPAAAAPPAATPAAATPAAASPTAASSAVAAVATRPGPAAPPPALSREQAVARLMALPELQAWARQIEQASHGAVHGAVIPFDATLRELDGKRYHQLGFVENRPDAAVTWQGFLVGAADGAILVDDAATGAAIPLERWRREQRPLQRTAR